jgi:CubicO group peptidase (beta-lactamase class C family)
MLNFQLPAIRLPRWLGIALSLAFAPAPIVAHAQTLTRDQVSAALPALDAMAKRIVDGGGVPGLAIAVVHDDEIVFLRGYGVREAGKPAAVDPDTVFQLASLSKPISSTVVAALVSAGIVSWESRIADLDPQFRLKDAFPTAELTIRDLFSHRSGLPGTAGDDLEDIGYERAAVLARLRLAAPSSSFRAGYSYSNFALTEGAVAAAKPTGKPWEAIAEEMLYRPLGMASTSSRHSDFVSRANRSALHIRIAGAWVAKLKRDADSQAPAGGVSASARDLAQWMRLELANGAHDGRQVIAEAAIGQTHVPLVARGENPVTGAASFYGLGWNVEFGRHGLVWGHAGAFSLGARTLVSLHPKARLGIIVLTNAFPTGVPEGIADTFADLAFDGKSDKDWVAAWNGVYDGLFGPAVAAAKAAYASPPAQASAALSDSAYAGRYANAYVGDAFVAAENGGLKLEVGPNRAISTAISSSISPMRRRRTGPAR